MMEWRRIAPSSSNSHNNLHHKMIHIHIGDPAQDQFEDLSDHDGARGGASHGSARDLDDRLNWAAQQMVLTDVPVHRRKANADSPSSKHV